MASPIIAEPKSHFIGDFACESGTERYSVGIYITIAPESGGKLSMTLMAAHPDGHGAAPDGGGDGRVDANGIFRFTYEDSFFNKGRGTFRRTKRGYLLSIHIDDVQDSRCMPFYGEHLFQRRARKNWPNQAMPFRQAQGPELAEGQRRASNGCD